jgi:hypothetical protein
MCLTARTQERSRFALFGSSGFSLQSTVHRFAWNTCGRFELAWRHRPCWCYSMSRWVPTWLPNGTLCNLLHSHKCFHFASLSAHDSSTRCPPSLPLCSTLGFGFFPRLVSQHLSSPLSFSLSFSLCFYFLKSFLFPQASYLRFFFFLRSRLDWDSSVAVVTRYELCGLRIEYRWRRDFPHTSRSELGPS